MGLLTLFHPNWKNGDEPILAYTAKGRVIDKFQDKEWNKKYEKLSPVVLDIIKLYDYIHVNFQEQYKKALHPKQARLGGRKEVKYLDPNEGYKPKKLPLTGQETRHVLPDGWLYPLLASFRVLLEWPKNAKDEVKWKIDPYEYFDKNGSELVIDVVGQSEDLGRNANAAGKSRMLWRGLRNTV